MDKNAMKELRRPFVRELFRNNGFNLAMTVIAALLGAAVNLVVSAQAVKHESPSEGYEQNRKKSRGRLPAALFPFGLIDTRS